MDCFLRSLFSTGFHQLAENLDDAPTQVWHKFFKRLNCPHQRDNVGCADQRAEASRLQCGFFISATGNRILVLPDRAH
ncbi:MAG: hypothetical protein AB8B85_06830 [Paracoccaceae bacterium]